MDLSSYNLLVTFLHLMLVEKNCLQNSVAYTFSNIDYVLTSLWALPYQNMCFVLSSFLLAVLSDHTNVTGIG
jgi:hypothetical protein